MSNRGLWLEGGTTFPDRRARAAAVLLALAWALLIAARNLEQVVPSRAGCSTDPADFLVVGEFIELNALAMLVQAHCPDARYTRDGWIELQHGGGRVDVALRRVDIGSETYFEVVSIGGVTAAS
jgi:hypothetical protein